jgi:hypothetical protein
MRVNRRVYIINDVAMPSQFHLPFVIHWNYSAGGMALRALVVTEDIQLPAIDYQPRFSLQDYVRLVPCEMGLAILACPHSGSGLKAGMYTPNLGPSAAIQRRRRLSSASLPSGTNSARRSCVGRSFVARSCVDRSCA